eukprot:321437_1
MANTDVNELDELFQNLRIAKGDNAKLAELNKKYDDDEKVGYGNDLDADPDEDDKQVILIAGKVKIDAPTSIQWKLGKYQIDWGLRGSFCGLGIGRKRFIVPETGDIKVLFHFGFTFSGNDYVLTEPIFGSEFPDRHWMLLHLVNTDEIGVELCGSKPTACQRLSQVWRKQGEIESKDYKYLRLVPGFCRTSVQVIAGLINNEKSKNINYFMMIMWNGQI